MPLNLRVLACVLMLVLACVAVCATTGDGAGPLRARPHRPPPCSTGKGSVVQHVSVVLSCRCNLELHAHAHKREPCRCVKTRANTSWWLVLQSAAEKREYALQLLGQKEAAVVRRRKELQVRVMHAASPRCSGEICTRSMAAGKGPHLWLFGRWRPRKGEPQSC